ncbi:MAG TPA: hypothetical protein VJV05_08420 [Pyrinomonadaceae bacterium]|nr:hypothetical protein [Pyrinomonadaceae bacterium]
MRRRIMLSIALVLSVAMLTLLRSDSSVQAESPRRFVTDTGVVTLGPNQSLRMTVARSNAATEDDGPSVQHILQFTQMTYAEDSCNGNLCKQTVASVTTSGVIQLLPGESRWATFPSGIVRGRLVTNRPEVEVNVLIIDNATGEILSIDKSTPKLLECCS